MGKKLFQLVANPFDPLKREIILELDDNGVCSFAFGIRGKALVFSNFGDMFRFDFETGDISRRFIGKCPFGEMTYSLSGNVFATQYREHYEVKKF